MINHKFCSRLRHSAYHKRSVFGVEKITEKLIETVVCQSQKQVIIIRDSELRGFGLRVTRAGQKSFIVEARVKGKNKRLTIGRADLFSVDSARKEAMRLLAQMTTGIDPQAEKEQSEKAGITLGEVLDHYLTVQRMKPITAKRSRALMNAHFRDWLPRPITAITPEMIQARHSQIGETKQTTAIDAIWKLSAIINFAINNSGLEISNPVQIMNKNRAWFKSSRSPLVIPDHLLPVWYEAVARLRSTKIRDFFLLLLLTGLRRGEGLRLRWEHVDFEARLLTVPAEEAKNCNEHKLPISEYLLAQRKAECGDSEWVFPRTSDPRFHMEKPQEVVAEVLAGSGVPWSPHALRRVFVTVASRMGIPHHICRKLLNHIGDVDISSSYIIIVNDSSLSFISSIGSRRASG